MKGAGKVLTVLVALGAVAGAVYAVPRLLEASSRAGREARAQEGELEACRKTLATIGAAWGRYSRANEGADPPGLEALIPKYLSDLKILQCPTAARWLKEQNRVLEQGKYNYKGTDYPVTYSFALMGAARAHLLKRFGERAPVARCDAHREAMYRAYYQRRPPLGALQGDSAAHLASPVRRAPVPAARLNGEVADLTGDEI